MTTSDDDPITPHAFERICANLGVVSQVSYILNRDGDPVPCTDAQLWAAWFHENGMDVRGVALTPVGECLVSTVFVGVDMNHARSGAPLLFETMVFRRHGGPSMDEYTDRYATRAEALAGHRATVEALTERTR